MKYFGVTHLMEMEPNLQIEELVSIIQDVTEKFLKENNLKLLIRSHEARDEGYSIEMEEST